ncbi:DUF333 domain-containing protein [Thiohalocapsa marina]|uniref:DUF333 domain-containing protein n=1 Tax=Thiohalocapsa marina TaxID=424902 RepID=A0A5M8FAK7_9GAMM|nr:DUF333 domain-containing protein [Thiohalocapsa marina]KAA6181767.1 DUF333 domain-containing protein [Thiohalocapsa marina]
MKRQTGHWSLAAAITLLSIAPITAQALGPMGVANPASVHCIEQGGTLDIRTRPDGGEYGVCVFEDNRQCEEWALLRGQCPNGGLKITGYDTAAQIYCAITGGQVEMATQTCRSPDGVSCALEAYFSGRCPAPSMP